MWIETGKLSFVDSWRPMLRLKSMSGTHNGLPPSAKLLYFNKLICMILKLQGIEYITT